MTRKHPFIAVIADMDGVLTRTAGVHEQAWKRMFDDVLSRYDGQRPFSSADYRAHVDGKPRYEGAADFLRSRDIELPRGTPDDGAEAETIYGLGNRKNQIFIELIEQHGVEVFDDVLPALERWRRGGLDLAVVSASRNCQRILSAANLTAAFDAIVDGEVAGELELDGKAGIMLEAARRLDTRPSDAVIVEDSTAGIRAGRVGGFGRLVGIARHGNESDLKEAGAHEVVSGLGRVRFERRIPDALDRLEELSQRLVGHPVAVFLDYDGTLAEIVDDPDDAWMSDSMRSSVIELAGRCPVAIISGRDRLDVEKRVDIDNILYAGNHGFDIAGRGHSRTPPEAESALSDVQFAEDELRRRLGRLTGVIIERKRFSVAAHYRQVDTQTTIERVFDVAESIRDCTSLRLRRGKKVVELEPAIDWDKGRALEWLRDVLHESGPICPFVVYIGDDETDEDAFAALAGQGIGVRVDRGITSSLADYQLDGPAEVRELLVEIARLCGSVT